MLEHNLPAVTPSLALKSDKHSIPSGYKVVLLHRPAEGIAECLDDSRVIRPRCVVESEGLTTVARPGYYGGLYAVYAETGDN